MSQYYEKLDERYIEEINSQAIRYRHITTGAEVLSMINDDENKVFGITLRTSPPNSTGLPHIMEHSVLAGSRKFPVKEPYIELVKGSLKTYANALTFPDRTCYPCASQNLADFYNLIDVYLDAVFYPLLPPRILDQEGWHLELNDPDDPLTYKGVVYNEMKGVYSDPQNYLGRLVRASLFPENAYRHDSGGDPAVIPQLTFDDFQQYHEVYYHPSNAFIFFSGDDPPEQRLDLLQEYLKDFDYGEEVPSIGLQPPFVEPRLISAKYPAGEGNDSGDKGFVVASWLLPENNELEQNLAFSVLEHSLIGTPGSQLRKAMIDSGLGEDLVSSGLADYLQQMYFAAGLKGVAMDDLDKVESMILTTFQEIADNGIDPGAVEAAVNTMEFYLRERNSGGYPRGLIVMFQALSVWIYGGDPLDWLAYERALSSIKAHLVDGSNYLESLIRKYILENNHRLIVHLIPDVGLQAEQQKGEEERLAEIRAKMTQDELDELLARNKKLQEFQETPDSPESLASLPTLKLGDLAKDNQLVPTEFSEINGVEILTHDLFTDGIAYLDLAFDLRKVSGKHLAYIPLLSRALLGMGTEKEDYVRLTQRIGQHTGGIYTRIFTSDIRGETGGSGWLIFRTKAILEKNPELFAILEDILLHPQFDDRDRFQQILLKERVSLETSVVRSGRSIIDRRLRSRFSESAWASEQMNGIEYLFFIRDLANDFDSNWEELKANLVQVYQTLLNRGAMKVNLTVPKSEMSLIHDQLSDLLGNIPETSVAQIPWRLSENTRPEGLVVPTQVNYVGKGASLYKLGYNLDGSIQVILNYLRTTWLWERIRVQGGAYSASPNFGRQSGVLTLTSYRDPNLLQTLDVFDGSGDFLKTSEISNDEIRKSIIGAIGTIDAYRLPDAKGYVSMMRHLIHESEETRQILRDQVLGTTIADFRAFSEVLEEFRREGMVAALGSNEAFERAHRENTEFFTLLNIL